MLTVAVLRHQERPANQAGFDTHLTPAGAAAAASDRYAPLVGLPVISSPFLRCLQTVAPWRGPLVVDHRLREYAPGVCLPTRPLAPHELGPDARVAEEEQQPAQPDEPSASESPEALRRRVQSFADWLVRQTHLQRLVVCTHQSCATELMRVLGREHARALEMGEWVELTLTTR